MAPVSHWPIVAPPGGHDNVPDLVETCAPRSTFSSCTMAAYTNTEYSRSLACTAIEAKVLNNHDQ